MAKKERIQCTCHRCNKPYSLAGIKLQAYHKLVRDGRDIEAEHMLNTCWQCVEKKVNQHAKEV